MSQTEEMLRVAPHHTVTPSNDTLCVAVELPSGASLMPRWITEHVSISKLRQKASQYQTASEQMAAHTAITPHMISTHLISKLRLEHHLRRDDFNNYSLCIRERVTPHLLAGQQSLQKTHGLNTFVDSESIELMPTDDVLMVLRSLRRRYEHMDFTLTFLHTNSRHDNSVNRGTFDLEVITTSKQTIPADSSLRFLKRLSLFPFVHRPVNRSVEASIMLKAVIAREYAKSHMCGFIDILHPTLECWQERWVVLTANELCIFAVVPEILPDGTPKEPKSFLLRPLENVYIKSDDFHVSVVGLQEWQVYSAGICYTFRSPGSAEMLRWVASLAYIDRVMSDNMLLVVPDGAVTADSSLRGAWEGKVVETLASCSEMLNVSVLRDRLQHYAKQLGLERLILCWIHIKAYEFMHPVPADLQQPDGLAEMNVKPHLRDAITSRAVCRYATFADKLTVNDALCVTFHALSLFSRFLAPSAPAFVDVSAEILEKIRQSLAACLQTQRGSGTTLLQGASTHDTMFPGPALFKDVFTALQSKIEKLVYVPYCKAYVRYIQPGSHVKPLDKDRDVFEAPRKTPRASFSARMQRMEPLVKRIASKPVPPPTAPNNSIGSRTASTAAMLFQQLDKEVLRDNGGPPPSVAIMQSVATMAQYACSFDDTTSDRVMSPLSFAPRRSNDADGSEFAGRSCSTSVSEVNRPLSPGKLRSDNSFSVARKRSTADRMRLGSVCSSRSDAGADTVSGGSQGLPSVLQLIAPWQIQQWRKRWNAVRHKLHRFDAASIDALSIRKKQHGAGFTGVDTDILLRLLHKYKIPSKDVQVITAANSFMQSQLISQLHSSATRLPSSAAIPEDEALYIDSASESGPSSLRASFRADSGYGTPTMTSATNESGDSNTLASSAWAYWWLPRPGALINTVVEGDDGVEALLFSRQTRATTTALSAQQDSVLRGQDAASQAALLSKELRGWEQLEQSIANCIAEDKLQTGKPPASTLSNGDTHNSATHTAAGDEDDAEFRELFGFARDVKPDPESPKAASAYVSSCFDWANLAYEDVLLDDTHIAAVWDAASAKSRASSPLSVSSSIRNDSDADTPVVVAAEASARKTPRSAAAGVAYVVPQRILEKSGLQQSQKALITADTADSSACNSVVDASAESSARSSVVTEAIPMAVNMLPGRRARVSLALNVPRARGSFVLPAPATPSMDTATQDVRIKLDDVMPLLPLRVLKCGWMKVHWSDAASHEGVKDDAWFAACNGSIRSVQFIDTPRSADRGADRGDRGGRGDVEGARSCTLEVNYDACLASLTKHATQQPARTGVVSDRVQSKSRISNDIRRKSLADEVYFGKALDDSELKPAKRSVLNFFQTSNSADANKGSGNTDGKDGLTSNNDASIMSEGVRLGGLWTELFGVLYADGTLAFATQHTDISDEACYIAYSAYFSSLHRSLRESPFIGAIHLPSALDIAYARGLEYPAHALEIVTRRGVVTCMPKQWQEAGVWLSQMCRCALNPVNKYSSRISHFSFKGITNDMSSITATAPSTTNLSPVDSVRRALQTSVVADGSGSQIRTAALFDISLQKKGRYGGQWKTRQLRLVASCIHREIAAVPPIYALPESARSRGSISATSSFRSSSVITHDEMILFTGADAHHRDAQAVRAWAACLGSTLAPGFVDSHIVPMFGSQTIASPLLLLACGGASSVTTLDAAFAQRVGDVLPLFARLLLKAKQSTVAKATATDYSAVFDNIPVTNFRTMEVAALYFKATALKGSIPLLHHGVSRIIRAQAKSTAATLRSSSSMRKDDHSAAGKPASFSSGVKRMLGFGKSADSPSSDTTKAAGSSPPGSPVVRQGPPKHIQLSTSDRVWEFAVDDSTAAAELAMFLRIFTPSRTEQMRRRFTQLAGKPYTSSLQSDIKLGGDTGSAEMYTIPMSTLSLAPVKSSRFASISFSKSFGAGSLKL